MIAQAITNETNHFQLKPDMYPKISDRLAV